MKGKRTITCCTNNSVPLVAVTQQKTSLLTRHDSTKENSTPHETVLKLMHLLGKIDRRRRGIGHETHVWPKKESYGRQCYGNRTFFGCNRCGWRPSCKKNNKPKTTRSRCNNRPPKRANGISPPASLRKLVTADHKNNKSRR